MKRIFKWKKWKGKGYNQDGNVIYELKNGMEMLIYIMKIIF